MFIPLSFPIVVIVVQYISHTDAVTAPCRVRPAERLLWVRLPSEGLDASWCHRLDIAIV